jgi:hypothetical protein
VRIRILLIGAGGVGSAFCAIAARRVPFLDLLTAYGSPWGQPELPT